MVIDQPSTQSVRKKHNQADNNHMEYACVIFVLNLFLNDEKGLVIVM